MKSPIYHCTGAEAAKLGQDKTNHTFGSKNHIFEMFECMSIQSMTWAEITCIKFLPKLTCHINENMCNGGCVVADV